VGDRGGGSPIMEGGPSRQSMGGDCKDDLINRDGLAGKGIGGRDRLSGKYATYS